MSHDGPPDPEDCLKMLRTAFPDCEDAALLTLLDHPGWTRLKAGDRWDPAGARERLHLMVTGCLAWGERRVRNEEILQLPNPRFAGDILGEWSLLLPEALARTRSRPDKFGEKVVMTIMPTCLKELNTEAYAELLKDATFTLQVARRQCRDNGTVTQLIAFHAAHEKEVVLARYLIILLMRMPLLEIEGKRCLRVTQENLSRLSCLSRKYVGNFLRQWEKDNVVEGHHGMLVVLDELALLKRARIDATGIAPPAVGHPVSEERTGS